MFGRKYSYPTYAKGCNKLKYQEEGNGIEDLRIILEQKTITKKGKKINEQSRCQRS